VKALETLEVYEGQLKSFLYVTNVLWFVWL